MTATGPTSTDKAPPPPPSADPPTSDARASRTGRLGRFLNVGAIIAALGFVFGLVTWTIDQRAQDRADRRQARSELTGILSDLAALPRQYTPLLLEADGVLEQNLTSLYADEAKVLIAQARAIVESSPDITTAGDYLAIGNGQWFAQDSTGAVDSWRTAEVLAVDDDATNTATVIRRILGFRLLQLGFLDEGRKTFQRAVEWDGLTAPEGLLRTAEKADTHSQWAVAEASIGDCRRALGQVDLARSAVPRPGEVFDDLLAKVEVQCEAG